MALPAGGVVGQIADRVERLAGRAAGDHGAQAGERPRRPAPARPRSRPGSRAARPCARQPTSPQAMSPGFGPTTRHPVRRQPRQVAPRRRRAPTSAGSSPGRPAPACRTPAAAVEARSSARPAAILRHQVGRRRRHHHQVRLARQPDVAHLGLVGEREQLARRPSRRRGSPRTRASRTARAAGGQHAAERQPALAAAPDQLQAFVGGDAAADDQEHPPAVRHRPHRICNLREQRGVRGGESKGGAYARSVIARFRLC